MRRVCEVICNLVEAFADEFLDMGVGPTGDGDFGRKTQGCSVSEPSDPHFGHFMTPANGAFQGFIEVILPDVVNDVEGALGIFLVVLVDTFEEGALGFWGMAFLKVGEIYADDGWDEVGVFGQEFLYPFVVLFRCPAAQADDITAREAILAGPFEGRGIFTVKGDELVAC